MGGNSGQITTPYPHFTNKKARQAGLFSSVPPRLFRWADIRGLLAFGASGDIETHLLIFSQGFETIALNCGEVREQILATAIRGNKAEAFRIVKPFNSASSHVEKVL
jgi:hypothetical protein